MVIIAIFVALLLPLVLLFVVSVKRKDDEQQYYDKQGNHIYYDRKLIRQLEKESQNH